MITDPPRLNTVSLRLRVTIAVVATLAGTLLATSLVINAVFVAQSERSLEALLSGRVQLARQLARSGVGPQQLVTRVQADGVGAHLVLRGGAEFGSPAPTGQQALTRTTGLVAPGRLDGARLTLAVDTSRVTDARRTLRQVLVATGLGALLVSVVVVALAVRLALRPLAIMAQTARTIAAGRRGTRLSPTRTDTEIGQTALAFDTMLDELEGAESAARGATRQTREFLANAAHELRTPIAGVLAATETLLQQGDRLDRDQRERLLELLGREAHRSGKLVSDLLTVARLDAGVEVGRTALPLRRLIADEAERARLLAPSTRVIVSDDHVDPDLRPVDHVVLGDADKISSILRNLVDNALRAVDGAGSVTIALTASADVVTITVADSGPGVPPADREQVFERLVRLDNARQVDTSGSGLGLAIARGYARAHGGDLVCADGPGGRFVLTLPVTPPEDRLLGTPPDRIPPGAPPDRTPPGRTPPGRIPPGQENRPETGVS